MADEAGVCCEVLIARGRVKLTNLVNNVKLYWEKGEEWRARHAGGEGPG